MAPTRDQWIAAFAREAGLSGPSLEEIRELLDLAGTAAHSSERTAAPLACWIAGRSELSLPQLRAIAEGISAAAEAETETGVEPEGKPAGGGPAAAG
jgi:Domain of unknown function (DUF6457)